VPRPAAVVRVAVMFLLTAYVSILLKWQHPHMPNDVIIPKVREEYEDRCSIYRKNDSVRVLDDMMTSWTSMLQLTLLFPT
jgi:hypothetical protein